MLTVDEIEENTGKLLGALGARPHVAFRTRSVEAVRSLVATGAGVALLPDLVYRPWSLEGDRIESRDISGSLPVVQVGMVWRRGSGLPQARARFHRHRPVAARDPQPVDAIGCASARRYRIYSDESALSDDKSNFAEASEKRYQFCENV